MTKLSKACLLDDMIVGGLLLGVKYGKHLLDTLVFTAHVYGFVGHGRHILTHESYEFMLLIIASIVFLILFGIISGSKDNDDY